MRLYASSSIYELCAVAIPIEPLRVGRSRRRRFTLGMLKEMARSCQRQGVINRQECERVLAELARAAR